MQGGHCACCLPGRYSLQLCSLMRFSPCFCISSLSHDMFEHMQWNLWLPALAQGQDWTPQTQDGCPFLSLAWVAEHLLGQVEVVKVLSLRFRPIMLPGPLVRVSRGHSQPERRAGLAQRDSRGQSHGVGVPVDWCVLHLPWLASWHSSAHFPSVLEDLDRACLMPLWYPAEPPHACPSSL